MGAVAEGRPHDFISSFMDQLQLMIVNAGLLLPNLLTFQRSKSGILCVCVCVNLLEFENRVGTKQSTAGGHRSITSTRPGGRRF